MYGYKDLKIDLAFDSLTLLPLLAYSYSEKKEDINTVEEVFKKYLAKESFINKEEEWMKCKTEERLKFEIPDNLLFHKYKRGGKIFKIFKIKLDNEIGEKLITRLQILTLLYIEGGSFIDIEDPIWEILVIYEEDLKEGDILVGFCTVYKYWKFNGNSLKYDEEKENINKYTSKISQMVILPPFQNKGHGSEIYFKLINEWFKDSNCLKITVEDPSEEFDLLRDKNDLKMLIEKIGLNNEKESLKFKNKLTKRQKTRMNEIIENLNGNIEESRKMVKRRIYLNNYEGLKDWGSIEISNKLQEVYENVYKQEIEPLINRYRGEKRNDLN